MNNNSEQINLRGIPLKWLNRQTPKHYSQGIHQNKRPENFTEGPARQSDHYHKQNIAGDPENKLQLNVQHSVHVLTDNYCSIPQDTVKSSFVDFAKYFCKWKPLHCPIILFILAVIFLGIIAYGIWLNHMGMVRKHYLDPHKQRFSTITEGENVLVDFEEVENSTKRIVKANKLQKASTILKALTVKSKSASNESKSITPQADLSKSDLEWRNHNEESYAKESTTLMSDEAVLAPIKTIRFTSGHQNSFGIPIEDDERILKLINGISQINEATTIANVHTTVVNVYPTIPHVQQKQGMDVGTLQKSSTQDNGCYSTSLDMCRGVLDYDLTYNSSIGFTEDEMRDYKLLVQSNCSARALEFICIFLEPECRSAHIGVLPPCRRICKAILEACSIVIASSDVLTAMFDCNLYPDSNDIHRCDDPTKRKNVCYNVEYQCYDHSCIPHQWLCDNIKDCADGEDESQCLICDQVEEFRCRSNEKCIPATARCDIKYDCFDGSDEEDCISYSTTRDNENLQFNGGNFNAFPHVFPYSEYLLPNQTNNKTLTYITATESTAYTREMSNQSISGALEEDVGGQVPEDKLKGFVNVPDGKEIMITSDSENQPKFSSTNATYTPSASIATISLTLPRDLSKIQTTTCAPHELRCVSGKCITVDDLCNKHIDCPDGFDELMCEYKDISTASDKAKSTLTTVDNKSVNSSKSLDTPTARTSATRQIFK